MNNSSEGLGTHEIKTESAMNLSQGFLNYFEFHVCRYVDCRMLNLKRKCEYNIGTKNE